MFFLITSTVLLTANEFNSQQFINNMKVKRIVSDIYAEDMGKAESIL